MKSWLLILAHLKCFIKSCTLKIHLQVDEHIEILRCVRVERQCRRQSGREGERDVCKILIWEWLLPHPHLPLDMLFFSPAPGWWCLSQGAAQPLHTPYCTRGRRAALQSSDIGCALSQQQRDTAWRRGQRRPLHVRPQLRVLRSAQQPGVCVDSHSAPKKGKGRGSQECTWYECMISLQH